MVSLQGSHVAELFLPTMSGNEIVDIFSYGVSAQTLVTMEPRRVVCRSADRGEAVAGLAKVKRQHTDTMPECVSHRTGQYSTSLETQRQTRTFKGDL